MRKERKRPAGLLLPVWLLRAVRAGSPPLARAGWHTPGPGSPGTSSPGELVKASLTLKGSCVLFGLVRRRSLALCFEF